MKKLLPPQLFILFVILMGTVCWATGSQHNLSYPYNLTGIPLLLGGIILAQASKNIFRKKGTNVNTFDRPDLLITDGPFRFSRNPMYLGFALGIIGVALLNQASFVSFITAASFIVITDRWYIRIEEKIMRETFGKEYEEYCRKTRRWV